MASGYGYRHGWFRELYRVAWFDTNQLLKPDVQTLLRGSGNWGKLFMIFMHHFLLEELTQNGEVSGIQVLFFP